MPHMPTLDEPVAVLLDQLKAVAVSAVRPTTDADGVDITSWRINGYAPPLAAMWIDAGGAATVSSPAEAVNPQGVELWAYVTGLAKWYLITELRDGRDIEVTAARGYTQAANTIGVFDRIAVVGAIAPLIVVTARFAPMESY